MAPLARRWSVRIAGAGARRARTPPFSPPVPGKGNRAPSSGGDFRAPYSAIPHTIVTLAVIFTSPAATGTGAAALKLASAIGIGTGGW